MLQKVDILRLLLNNHPGEAQRPLMTWRLRSFRPLQANSYPRLDGEYSHDRIICQPLADIG